jgi:hypothetical protein
MLKFSVQTFYQPLFSHSFPFSNFPLAVLFPSESVPHQKAKAPKTSKAKAQSKSQPSFSRPFTNHGKQGGPEALGDGHDIVTGFLLL